MRDLTPNNLNGDEPYFKPVLEDIKKSEKIQDFIVGDIDCYK